ncbi:MAG: hypothetical protein ABI614_21655, partial [Planctomycetota bacterium]
MANEIRIQPSATALVRGQAMTVPVVLVLDRRLKVRGIHAKFLGAEETTAVYTTTSTDSKGRVTTRTHTAVQQVEFVSQVHLLSGNEKKGFFGNMTDAAATVFGGGQHDTLEPGEYPFEVEVSIPDDAPATHDAKKSRVFYELSIHVDVPAGFDLKATHSFQVEPLSTSGYETTPARTRYPDDAGRGLFDALVSPDTRLEMALVADKFQPHELIEGILTIEVRKSINCRKVLVQLVGMEHSEAHGHKDVHVYLGDSHEVASPGTVTGNFTQEFSIPAQTTSPLTARGKLFSIDWFVQIQLDVPWA